MAKDTTSTKERQEELLNAISTWISSKVSDPEHMPGTNNRMKYVLFHGIIADEAEPEPSHARSQPIKTHGQLVTGYLGLVSLVFSLRECEYYFRRYPFKGLPISRSAHLRNAAEMVCDRVAQFRDRVKTITNHLNQLYPGERIQVGPILKEFYRRFDSFLRMRNQVHHHDRYDGIDVSQLSMVELLIDSMDDRVRRVLDPLTLYRRAAKEWQGKVRRAAASLDMFVEVIASLMLTRCTFLKSNLPTPVSSRSV